MGAVGLCRGKGAEGDKGCGVDGAAVIEKCADDLLEASETCGVKRFAGVSGSGELRCGAVDGSYPSVRGMLFAMVWFVLKLVQGALHVAGHG